MKELEFLLVNGEHTQILYLELHPVLFMGA